MEKAEEELKNYESKGLSEDEMLNAVRSLKDDAVYNVQGLISIGALLVSALAMAISLMVTFVQGSTENNCLQPARVLLSSLLVLGIGFAMFCLWRTLKCNKAYWNARNIENAILYGEKRKDK